MMLDIRGSGAGGYAVLHKGRVLARATSHGNAVARLAGLERQLSIRAARCLCCGAGFNSTGKGNRLCRSCRGAA